MKPQQRDKKSGDTLAQINPSSGILEHKTHELARSRRGLAYSGKTTRHRSKASHKMLLPLEQESLELMMTKIKEWPIVLTCSLHHWCRTPEWLAMLPFYSLNQLKGPEVVKMYDTYCETINTGSNERSDPPLFHETKAVAAKGPPSMA